MQHIHHLLIKSFSYLSCNILKLHFSLQLSLDVNKNREQARTCDFLLESPSQQQFSPQTPPPSELYNNNRCPIHGENGNILFESFKNHSLPMLSGWKFNHYNYYYYY